MYWCVLSVILCNLVHDYCIILVLCVTLMVFCIVFDPVYCLSINHVLLIGHFYCASCIIMVVIGIF